jgi:hypothetical protein
MLVNRSQLRAKWLLPFAAAAVGLLMFWMRTSGKKVSKGHLRTSEGSHHPSLRTKMNL